jgi:hypothetical protein
MKQKPSVHKLCYGAFIQEPLQLKENIFAFPLKPLGFSDESHYAARYVVDICDGTVDEKQLFSLKQQGENALPVIALVVLLTQEKDPKLMEADAENSLEFPEKIIEWAAGESLTPFAYITSCQEQDFFRILPPHSRRRQRLGFGNTGDDYSRQLSRMVNCAEKDEHFLFALGLYRDALAEENEVFKIARFFSCLESLAYKLKSEKIPPEEILPQATTKFDFTKPFASLKSLVCTKCSKKQPVKKTRNVPSRKAVKRLLGLEEGAMVHMNIQGKEYKYDRIEIAGRLRDKLFHGVPFTPKDLNKESKHVFELLENAPEQIANSLRDDCELEFARWANGASNGLKSNNV